MNNVLSLLSSSLVNPFTSEVLDLGIILCFQEICSIKLWLGITWLGHYMMSLKTGVLTSGIFGEALVVVQRYACYFFFFRVFCHGNESRFRSWNYAFHFYCFWLMTFLLPEAFVFPSAFCVCQILVFFWEFGRLLVFPKFLEKLTVIHNPSFLSVICIWGSYNLLMGFFISSP